MKLEGMIIKVDGKLYRSVIDVISGCGICDLFDCPMEIQDFCEELPHVHFKELEDV